MSAWFLTGADIASTFLTQLACSLGRFHLPGPGTTVIVHLSPSLWFAKRLASCNFRPTLKFGILKSVSENPEKLKHLEWAVESRARNQKSCLALYKLFEEHAETWRTKTHSRAAQELIAVAFSLWRAAFLAEKTGRRGEVFAHGRTFLGKIIEDNAISYLQDKNSREWTFNYYTRNARYSLEFLAAHWEGIVPRYEGNTRNAVQRWDYCQDLLDEAVKNFGALLGKKKSAKADSARRRSAKRDVKRGAKQRRAKVRELTLAGRATKSDS